MMRLLRVDPRRPSESALRAAADALKSGGIVVFPTETAYGLGCDAANRAAVKKIYAVKGRDSSKRLPLIVSSLAMARRRARFGPMSAALARRFWPGPLTLVLPAKGNKRDELAMRVSSHPVARALARRLGRPLISTSANRSGGETRYSIAGVLRDLGTMPDLVLDAGPLPRTKPSTIVRCAGELCQILRSGPISASDLRLRLSTADYRQ